MNRIDGLDLNLLRDLVLLDDTRSVTAAAERAAVTQSAMSHRLRRLREALDDPLFVPGPEGLSPTLRAEELSATARAVVEQLGAALRPSVPFDPAASSRHFRVATTDYAEFVVLPEVLERLRAMGSSITVSMPQRGPDDEGALRRGDIDLVVGARGRFRGDIRARVFLRESFEVAARVDHPTLAKRPELDLETYLSCGHIQIAPDGSPGGPIDSILASRGLRRSVRLQVSHFVTAPFLVPSTDDLLTAPARLLEHAARLVPLVRWPLPLAVPAVEICMYWHERSHGDPAHRWLREFVAETAADTHLPATGG